MEKDQINIQKKWFITSRVGNIQDFYDFDNKQLLGSGSFGEVVKANVKGGKTKRAIKIIKKQSVKDSNQFKAEINIMRELDHPNVLKLFEFFEDSRYVYLVMELCQGGELFDKILEKGNFNEGMARFYFKQIMSALNYIHSKNICHRDLKPENFLLLDTKDDSPLKIIDFGLSVHFDQQMLKKNGGKMVMTARAGTPYYISPEILKGNYDISCDIWSSGVILYIILSGQPPFFGDTDDDILQRVASEQYSLNIPELAHVSSNAKNLISKMICKPKDRLTASNVLKHPWMTVEDPKYNVDLNINIKSLKNFQNSNKLKKTILTYMASQLNTYEIQQLGQQFTMIDKNNDGTIEFEELKNCLKNMNAKEIQQLKEIFENLDTDGSGSINYNEFIAATIQENVFMKEDKLFQTFKYFDKDGSGKISAKELQEVLGNEKGHEEEWKQMIAMADQNGDGEIDYNEFIEMMSKNNKLQ